MIPIVDRNRQTINITIAALGLPEAVLESFASLPINAPRIGDGYRLTDQRHSERPAGR